MKYKLFTAADPSDSKIIGTADTVNVLPEFNKQGQICWRSRPGLRRVSDLYCLYDGTVFESVFGVPTWDGIDNENGIYSCTPGGTLSARIRTSLTLGTMKTFYIIYSFACFQSTSCNDSIYMRIFGDALELTNISTLCYGNVGADIESISFFAGYPARDCEPRAIPQGTVTVECVRIIDRDWASAGELEGKIYYP